MTVFVDTSALYALLDEDSEVHGAARRYWTTLLRSEDLITHNYVALETVALVQRRLGLAAVERLVRGLLPVATVVWIDEFQHAAAVSSVLDTKKRTLSLVDHVSFLVMRARGVDHAFAFDEDFTDAGFTTLPQVPPLRASG